MLPYDRILGIDPGETSGFAEYYRTPTGWQLSKVIDIEKDEIWSHLNTCLTHIDLVVCEDFITNPKNFDKSWQRHFTIQVIGAIKFVTWKAGVSLVLKPAGDKFPACGRLFGETYKRKPNQHYYDALLHAGFYLLNQGENVNTKN